MWIWYMIGIIACLLAFFATIMPLICAFVPRLGLFWLRKLQTKRALLYSIALPLASVSFYYERELITLITLILTIFFMLLSLQMRPWVIFQALDNPMHIKRDKVKIPENAMIIGISSDGTALAWPIEKMVRPRHIVNDTINGKPILVCYCAACKSGIIYQRSIEGRTLTFEVLSVWRRNMVMRDRETHTIWQHLTGEALSGQFKGKSLELLGGELMTWGAWTEEHPQTLLALEPQKTIYRRLVFKFLNKALRSSEYMSAPGFTDLGKEIDPHEEIFAITIEGVSKAYPSSVFLKTPLIRDKFSNTIVELEYNREKNSIKAHIIINEKERVKIHVERHLWLGWKEFHPETEVFSG
ncbi:MAG: DUF3179 domain-containing (seleno)protein [Promethearchaeota archaeon]